MTSKSDNDTLEGTSGNRPDEPKSTTNFWKPELFEDGEPVPIPLYAEDHGPRWREVDGSIVTKPLITKNLPKIFQFLPIHVQPKSREDVEVELKQQIMSFVGNIDNEEYNKLAEFCDPKHLETGDELKMSMSVPSLTASPLNNSYSLAASSSLNFCRNIKFRKEFDNKKNYKRKLKYRRVCFIPQPKDDGGLIPEDELLQPGEDIIFKVRVYKPFHYNVGQRNLALILPMSEIAILGRQSLWALRDSICCINDYSTGIDVSENPDELPSTFIKDLIPSNFMFINDVFYIDDRFSRTDLTAGIREWAAERKIGVFPTKNMDVKLQDINLKIGYPEVYVHIGDCEHVFTFCDVRLLHPSDPLRLSLYPFVTEAATSHHLYCSMCSEHSTKWIVKKCEIVPFDPTYFCDKCFKLYLYKDDKKVCNFKAYIYRGNEMNVLNPKH